MSFRSYSNLNPTKMMMKEHGSVLYKNGKEKVSIVFFAVGFNWYNELKMLLFHCNQFLYASHNVDASNLDTASVHQSVFLRRNGRFED